MSLGPGALRHEGFELDPGTGRLECRYAVGGRRFTETVRVPPAGPGAAPSEALAAAARLVHLLAGVSYYKTAAPAVLDLGETATTPGERAFLRTFYLEGLGEFAHRNGLDLRTLRIEGPEAPDAGPVRWEPDRARPLVPFGGGIDSIVTAESVRTTHPGLSLFVVSRPGDRFEAIERAVEVSGLPVVRAERAIDPALLRSAELGFMNGHVPVTGILSAVAVLAAAATGHGAVVMSNEWSASSPNLEADGRAVNHQWSKSEAFERAWRGLLAETFGPGPEYFSFLRARSELWVAERFSRLPRYHRAFRSCNRAFAADPARRLDHWCGTCDKCCFIDLVLSPYLAAGELAAVFGGREPLEDPSLAGQFRDLLGTGAGPKPFECVGDVEECRAAALAAAARPDRAGCALLQDLARQIPDPDLVRAASGRMLSPLGADFVPADYRTPGEGGR